MMCHTPQFTISRPTGISYEATLFTQFFQFPVVPWKINWLQEIPIQYGVVCGSYSVVTLLPFRSEREKIENRKPGPYRTEQVSLELAP